MGKSPGHVALLVVGALGGPLVQVVALDMCVNAVGGNLPFVQVGAIYLGAHLVASAAPCRAASALSRRPYSLGSPPLGCPSAPPHLRC